MKKLTMYKLLWYSSGIILIITGLISILNPTTTVVTFALLFGIAMLINGIIDIITFIKLNKFLVSTGQILTDGIIEIIISIFILANQLITEALLPFIFSMWIMFVGMNKMIHSLDLKKFKINGWSLYTFLGVFEVIVGILSFLKPVTTTIISGIIIGIIFITRGSLVIIDGITIHKWLKEIKTEILEKKSNRKNNI